MWMPHAPHCACSDPDAHGQRPLTRHPPSTGTASPFGASDPAAHASGFDSQTSLCARSGKSDQPRAHVDEARDPCRRAAAATELAHHIDVGPDRGLISTETLGHHQRAQARLLQGLDDLIGSRLCASVFRRSARGEVGETPRGQSTSRHLAHRTSWSRDLLALGIVAAYARRASVGSQRWLRRGEIPTQESLRARLQPDRKTRFYVIFARVDLRNDAGAGHESAVITEALRDPRSRAS